MAIAHAHKTAQLKLLSSAQVKRALKDVGFEAGQVSKGWQPASVKGEQASLSILKLKKSLKHGEKVVLVMEGDTVGFVRLAKSSVSAAKVAGAISAYLGKMEDPPKRASKPARSSSLSVEEKALLAKGGIDVSAPPKGKDAVQATTQLYKELETTSLSVEQAAEKLGVNDSRVRQRLLAKQPSLYGIKRGRSWLLPAFQFEAEGLVPGLDAVIAQVPKTAHPVSVYRWFTSPHQDLYLDDSESVPVTPLDWLKTGGDPKRLAELAGEI
jgi:hypothetical protein